MTGDSGRRFREDAWAFGRRLREDLLAQYQHEYGRRTTPPPCWVADELITDFLGARLYHDALPLDRFAEPESRDGRLIVTINSRTAEIPGVKDAADVKNVAKWHEIIHVTRDVAVLRAERPAALPGFDVAPKLICYRTSTRSCDREAVTREVWAEEAGRAAAVSYPALAAFEPFQQFASLSRVRSSATITIGWELLYLSAAWIRVNISALVKQLTLDGFIVVNDEDGRRVIYVQPTLVRTLGAA